MAWVLPKPVRDQQREKASTSQQESGISEGWKNKKAEELNANYSQNVYPAKSPSLFESLPDFERYQGEKRYEERFDGENSPDVIKRVKINRVE